MDEKLYYVPAIILYYILRESERHDVSAFGRLVEK